MDVDIRIDQVNPETVRYRVKVKPVRTNIYLYLTVNPMYAPAPRVRPTGRHCREPAGSIHRSRGRRVRARAGAWGRGGRPQGRRAGTPPRKTWKIRQDIYIHLSIYISIDLYLSIYLSIYLYIYIDR